MNILWAAVIGFLFFVSLFLLMQRSIWRILLGVVLLSNGANLVIFLGSGWVRGLAPLIGKEEETLIAGAADPLPQALILTAIVISFGITAFAVSLLSCLKKDLPSEDVDELVHTDRGGFGNAP